MTRTWIAVAASATLLLGATPALAQWIAPEQLEIVEGSGGIDPETGFVRITGEVRNRSNRTLEQPEVIVELFDASGKPIEVTGFLAETKQEAGVDLRDSVLTERTWLAPGEVAVFEYLRDPQKLGNSRYGSHKLSGKARIADGAAPRVAVEGFRSAGDADGFYTVSGTLKNTGTLPCRSPRAVLGFYSPDGKVVLATYEEPDATFQKTIAPGQTVAFARKSISTPAGSTIGEVKVWGDCALPE